MTADPPYRIRAAVPADLDRLVELWVALVRDQYRFLRFVRNTRYNREATARHLSALIGHSQVLVLDRAGRAEGFAAVVVNAPRLDFFYASANVSDLYVSPEARGQGWGRKLLAAAVEMVRERGLHAVTISVMTGNPARELYRRMGFRPEKETLILAFDEDQVRFGPQASED